MNKRIKKKIAKRIINKVGTEQTLTYFERKYFIKFFWTPLRKEVIRIGEQLKAEEDLEIQSMNEQINELNIAEVTDMTIHSVAEPTDVERIQNATDAMNNFGSKINPNPSVPAIEEPNKWNKLKGKVKGWFAK